MIQQPDQATAATSLAPPRPNLGPESLGPDRSSALVVASALLVGLILVAALVILWRRRRRSDRIDEAPGSPRDDSPETRLLALRDRARAILARRFGPDLRARTTEELAADGRLSESLGADGLAQLTALLRAGDRVLFDGEAVGTANGDPSSDLADWSALVASLARSR